MADAEAPLLASAATDEQDPPLAGVSDFRGRPVRRATSGGWRSALFVVVVEIAGSFAFFGVSANLITYLTGPLGHSNAAAAAAVNAWSGTACLMPLLGAFVADSFLGRYRSIILACTLYVLGYGMITLASTLPIQPSSPAGGIGYSLGPSSLQVAFFYVSLYLVAIAQGADKPCGLAFAADQFDPDHPKERASRSSLFNWWFFSMAVGISTAVAVVSYIQENVGWGVGFGLLCAIMLCTFAVFLVGTPTYRLYAPTPGAESPFARLWRSLAALARSSGFGKRRHQQHKEDYEDDTAMSEEARGVLRLVPIWAACLAYGVVYAQVMTLFNKQGRTLDRRVFGGLELPPAALQTLGPAKPTWCTSHAECWRQLAAMWDSEAWKEKNRIGRAKRGIITGTHHQGSTTVGGYARKYAAHNKVPVPNTYKAFHMAKLASATKAKPYDPATPDSSYNPSTAKRKEKYDGGFKSTLGEDADPSSQDLIPELIMVTGDGKKHGRPSLGASSFPIGTESLASIRARSTSSSLQIQRRDEPARELRAELEANRQETQQMREQMEAMAADNKKMEENFRTTLEAQRLMIANMFRANGLNVPDVPGLGAMIIHSPNTENASIAGSNASPISPAPGLGGPSPPLS